MSPNAANRIGTGSAEPDDHLLAEGLLALGLSPEPGLVDGLTRYLALLVKWNRVYNLTAIRDPGQMRTQHLLDSLAPLPVLKALARDTSAGPLLVDVGSGAGLPGVPLALAWPQLSVVMVEPVGKKAAFIQQAITALGLRRARVEIRRIEQITTSQLGRFPDLIISRAFASLTDFARSVGALAGPETVVCAMKGQRPDDELTALPAGWTVVDIVEQTVPQLHAQRHLVLMKPTAPAVDSPVS